MNQLIKVSILIQRHINQKARHINPLTNKQNKIKYKPKNTYITNPNVIPLIDNKL